MTDHLESYWRRGCEDARAERGPRRPFPDSTLTDVDAPTHRERDLANQRYMAGWRFGFQHQPAVNEGSEP